MCADHGPGSTNRLFQLPPELVCVLVSFFFKFFLLLLFHLLRSRGSFDPSLTRMIVVVVVQISQLEWCTSKVSKAWIPRVISSYVKKSELFPDVFHWVLFRHNCHFVLLPNKMNQKLAKKKTRYFFLNVNMLFRGLPWGLHSFLSFLLSFFFVCLYTHFQFKFRYLLHPFFFSFSKFLLGGWWISVVFF